MKLFKLALLLFAFVVLGFSVAAMTSISAWTKNVEANATCEGWEVTAEPKDHWDGFKHWVVYDVKGTGSGEWEDQCHEYEVVITWKRKKLTGGYEYYSEKVKGEVCQPEDCQEEVWHSECFESSCLLVEGEGENRCETDKDCVVVTPTPTPTPTPPATCGDVHALNYQSIGDCRYPGPVNPPVCVGEPVTLPPNYNESYMYRVDGDTVRFNWSPMDEHAWGYRVYFGMSPDNLEWNRTVEGNDLIGMDLDLVPQGHVWGRVCSVGACGDEVCGFTVDP